MKAGRLKKASQAAAENIETTRHKARKDQIQP